MVLLRGLIGHKELDINATGTDGRPPLSMACKDGREDLVKLWFARSEINVDAKDGISRTPLSYAAVLYKDAIAKLLLATNKIDINSRDSRGTTPLSHASHASSESWSSGNLVQLLLTVDGIDVNSKDNKGITALSHASGRMSRSSNIVLLLLARTEIVVDVKDEGKTPLLHACSVGRVETVKLLLATDKVNLNWRDRDGNTPLSYAVALGHTDLARLLLASKTIEPTEEALQLAAQPRSNPTVLDLLTWRE